jgi:transcriptional regulator with XRE-family HTH domain
VDFGRFIRRLGRNVRRARWRTGLTQEGAASAAGLTVRVLAELERGHGNPTSRTLFSIAETLRTTVADLTATGKEDPLPEAIEAPKRGRKPKPRRFPKRAASSKR